MVTLTVAQAEVNEADVHNARRLLARHGSDGNGRCRRCGSHYPCVPHRIAEAVLRTCAARA